MKQLLKYLAFCTIAVLLNSCNDSESDLLEAKVYFESKETRVRDKDCVKNRVKRAKIVRFTLC